MDAIRQPYRGSAPGHNLLNAAAGVLRPLPGLKQIAVGWVGGEVRLQNQPEGTGEQDVAVFASLAQFDEDLAAVQIHILDLDARQFRDPHGGVLQESEHDLGVADCPPGRWPRKTF